jgi:uncharacterized membrane protein (UPF0127 family)
VHKTTVIAIVASIAAGIGIIATTAFYFYPAISSILGASQEEDNNEQEPIMGQATPTTTTSSYRHVNVTVNGIELIADIAETNEQRTKGLSVKDSLAENEAMLFVFDTAQEHSFWMKNMKFPIDIIWLDSDKTVVHIEHNLQPCSFDAFCPTYKPNNNSALYVLETAAGFAEKHGIVEGARVEFQLNT